MFVLLENVLLLYKCKVFSRQAIRYSENSLICKAYWLWNAKLDMTPLGAGQDFCLGLAKFTELVRHIELAEERPQQTEKTVKISVLVMKHAGAVVTSTDFWLHFSLWCQHCEVDLFWLLAKGKGICKWLLLDTCQYLKGNRASSWAAVHSCPSATDFCPTLKIQYSFMKLPIQSLIKFLSCRQTIVSFPVPGDSWGRNLKYIFPTVSFLFIPIFGICSKKDTKRMRCQVKKRNDDITNVKTIHPR